MEGCAEENVAGNRVALLARATRTMKQCSFDTRSVGAPSPPACEEVFHSEWRVEVEDERIGRAPTLAYVLPERAP